MTVGLPCTGASIIKIAITGCGPAGLAAALVLERNGHAVSLFERFSSAQPVGSGIILQPTGLAVLQALDLREEIQSLGNRIDHMSGVTMPRGKQVLNVNYGVLGDDVYGLAVHRAALFEVLFDEVQARGIPLQTSIDVVSIQHTAQSVQLLDAARNVHGPFDLVVDASGANSPLHAFAVKPLRRRMLKYGAIWGAFDWPDGKFRSNYLEQRYVAAKSMIGVLPIGRHQGVEHDQVAFFWSLRWADYDSWLADGLDVWKRQVLSIWPETAVILEQIVEPEQMALAQYGHHTLSVPWGKRLVFIGDAAHATSPQLGQGANMALLDAWALGLALSRNSELAAALREYARLRRWHVRAFQLASFALTPFYQSDSRSLAWLRDQLFDPMSRVPLARRIVAGLISGMLGKPLERLQLP